LDPKENIIGTEKRYKKLFDESPVMMAVVNREGIFTECNKNLLRFSSIKRNELIGKHFSTLKKIFPEDISRYIRIYNNAVKGKIKSPFEVYIKADSGKTLSIECSVKLLKENGNIDGFLITLRDITKQKEAEKNIEHLCFHDKLTGLYNRDFFEEEMARLNTKRQLPLAIIMGDVNGLKIINDVFGHDKGDKLLCRVGNILNASLRCNDIVARWGGDEYVIILPKISEEDARNILGRIKARLNEKSTKTMPLSVSFGLSIKDDIDKDIRQVIREAETKMCRSKMIREQSPHSYIISSLEKALEERDYETEEHVRRIKDLAEKLGRELDLDEESIDNLILLAALHDVGKISVADDILLKIGALTDKEWEKIKKHPEIGCRIAESFSGLAPIARGILYHHEWWNGNGYPEGIKGDKIPLISRIISVVDAYDAMTNDRPYRKALSKKEAIEELKKCSGSQFDPHLVKRFIPLVNDEERRN
jgi:diguanylate cyclase (GGDEF)-like protein/PAS domain S-box-containing protein